MAEEKIAGETSREIKSEHKQVLDKIRSAYEKTGAKLLEKPEDWGLMEKYKSSDGTLQLDFDHGSPNRLYTADGYYEVLGSHTKGDYEKFMENLKEEFDVEEIRPKRPGHLYEAQASGPLVRLTPTEEK